MKDNIPSRPLQEGDYVWYISYEPREPEVAIVIKHDCVDLTKVNVYTVQFVKSKVKFQTSAKHLQFRNEADCTNIHMYKFKFLRRYSTEYDELEMNYVASISPNISFNHHHGSDNNNVPLHQDTSQSSYHTKRSSSIATISSKTAFMGLGMLQTHSKVGGSNQSYMNQLTDIFTNRIPFLTKQIIYNEIKENGAFLLLDHDRDDFPKDDLHNLDHRFYQLF